jgi:hypothetical protein
MLRLHAPGANGQAQRASIGVKKGITRRPLIQGNPFVGKPQLNAMEA